MPYFKQHMDLQLRYRPTNEKKKARRLDGADKLGL